MIFLAALIFAAMPLRGLDLPDLLYEMDIARQSLDRSTLQAIWQQQITAYQAAEKLRNAGLFVMHSTTFSPYLHQLYYRLGQQTHSPEVRWTPQTMQTVIALMRYIALFRTAEAFKSPPGMHVILTGWNQAGILPENDCESFSNFNITMFNTIAYFCFKENFLCLFIDKS